MPGPGTQPTAGGLQVLADSIRCARCEYALVGLDPDRVCPECGLPIRYSRAIGVADVDSAWLRNVHLGAALILAGMVVSIVFHFARTGLAVAFPLGAWEFEAYDAAETVAVIGRTMALVAAAAGVILVTTRADYPVRTRRLGAVAVLLRLCAAAAVMATIGGVVVHAVEQKNLGTIGPVPTQDAKQLAAIVALAAVLAMAFGHLVYLHWVARQVQLAGIALGFRLVLLLLMGVPATLFLVAAAFDGLRPGDPVLLVVWPLSLAAGILAILLLPYYIFLMLNLSDGLTARRQLWARRKEANELRSA